MLELELIEDRLRIWRGIILALTIVMLLASIFSKDNWSILSLVIAFFALVLFQMRSLPHTTYQVPPSPLRSSWCYCWSTSSCRRGSS